MGATCEDRCRSCGARSFALKLSGKPYFGIETATSDTETEDALRDSRLMKFSGKPDCEIETAASVTEFPALPIELPEGHQGPYASCHH